MNRNLFFTPQRRKVYFVLETQKFLCNSASQLAHNKPVPNSKDIFIPIDKDHENRLINFSDNILPTGVTIYNLFVHWIVGRMHIFCMLTIEHCGCVSNVTHMIFFQQEAAFQPTQHGGFEMVLFLLAFNGRSDCVIILQRM